MRTFAKFVLTICLASSLLGNAYAAINMTQDEWDKFTRNSYVYTIGETFTGEENKTVIGDVFTGAGMGALMLVKTSAVILSNIGFRFLDDVSDELIKCEKRIRNQYSRSYQNKQYKREHPY